VKDLFGFSYDNKVWTLFDILWPWIGLVAAAVILIFLFTTNTLRLYPNGSRWKDAVWLSWLSVPIYMIHEFEEYGVDLLGVRHAFPDGLCRNLGLSNYPSCPIPHEFYLYVNLPLVWFFGILAAMISRRNSFVGLGLYSVIISNGVVHILTALLKREYNPGLFTAAIIFLPSFLWLCKACFGRGRFSEKGVVILIITGIILHAILISSIFLFVGQKINSTVLNLIQAINASSIILIPWLGNRLFMRNQVH